MQSILSPAGTQAGHIAWLWWLMLGVCSVVFVAVIGALFAGVWRAASRHAPEPVPHRRLTRIVGGATVMTVVILFVLLGASIATGRATQSLARHNALAITVVGNQWWWSVEYSFPQASDRVRLANELHLPRGRTAVITLGSNDVIHSFWVPNLHGKIDLIPGRLNEIVLNADRAGVYRGQCAEYCGTQHAHMAFPVIVQEPADFDAWLAAQRQAAAAPESNLERQGASIVTTKSCAMCHAVRGTTAGGRTAPDLTHLASRRSLAAGVLPNTPEALDRWLLDPQAVKPGNKMPNPGLSSDERAAVVAYLRTLR
jgi:cytochrome c oxidase subunit II